MSTDPSTRPAVRKGFVRFSNTAVDVKWETIPVGTEFAGRWLGWRPSIDPSWSPLGMIEIAGVVKTLPLPTALRILQRVPAGTEVVIVYLGKRKGKRGMAFHDFACDCPEGTVLLEPRSADPDDINQFAPRETTGR